MGSGDPRYASTAGRRPRIWLTRGGLTPRRSAIWRLLWPASRSSATWRAWPMKCGVREYSPSWRAVTTAPPGSRARSPVADGDADPRRSARWFSLCLCEGREHEEGPGSSTRCVRTMPPRSPDAARKGGRARSDERVSVERSPDGRSPPVSTDAVRASLLSWRGDFRRRCRERATAVVDRTPVEHPEDSEPGPTHTPSSSEPVEPSWTSEERSSQMTDRSAEPVPRLGAEAPWCACGIARSR